MMENYFWAKKRDKEQETKIKYHKYWTNSYDFISIDTSEFINKNKFKKIYLKMNIKNY